MNAITTTKTMKASLTMTLGAVLVAGLLANAPARGADLDDFPGDVRARVLNEATSQPGPEARVAALRGALEGVRIVAEQPTLGPATRQVLADIRAEQLAEMHDSALEQISGSMSVARVDQGTPAAESLAEQAIAAIRAEQIEDLNRRAPGQLAASMANAHVMTSVAFRGPAAKTRMDD